MRLQSMQSELYPDVGANRGADGTANDVPVLVTDSVSDVHANFHALVGTFLFTYDDPNESADSVPDVRANTRADGIIFPIDGSN
jgi:hypothetical protein